MEERGSPENRLVDDVDIPSLQEMASYQVALSMFYTDFSRLERTNDVSRRVTFAKYIQRINYIKDYNRLVETLNTPKSIEELIKIAFIRITNEMREWSVELRSINDDLWSIDPDWFVWSSDGKINRERSALKTLSIAGELSDEQKFAIMCEYCLENELVKFPVDSLPADFIEQARQEDNKLIEYWYYYVKKEHNLTPLYAEVIMSFGPKKWIAFQYFWHRMGKDWQIRVAESIFKYSNSDGMPMAEDYRLGRTNNVAQFFIIISWELQCHLLSKKLMAVILTLIRYGDSLKPVCWIWTHYKNLISVRNFVEIVYGLIDFRVKEEQWMNWLVHVWDSVSDQFKIAATKRVKNSVFRHFRYYFKASHDAFTFLCRILSLQDMDFRKKLILKNAVNFGLSIADHHSMKKLLNICLPNEDDRSNFRKIIVESDEIKYACVTFIYDSKLVHLNMMLDFYFTTSDEIRKFKKELLKSKEFQTVRFMVHLCDWRALSMFIDEIYPENDLLASRTRKQLISSWDFDLHKIPMMVSYGDMTHFIEIVESEFDVAEVDILKRVWIHSFRLMLETRDSDWCGEFIKTKSYHWFLKWCVGDGNRTIPEYEYEAFVDTLFDGVFRTLDNLYNEQHGFFYDEEESLLVALDEYLERYLMSDEKVKKYKSSKMTSPNVMKIFHSMSSRNDKSRLQKFLDRGYN